MSINLDLINGFAFNLCFCCTETQKRDNGKKTKKWTIFAPTQENVYVKKNLLYVCWPNRHACLYTPFQLFLIKFGQQTWGQFFFVHYFKHCIFANTARSSFLEQALAKHGECPYHIISEGIAAKFGIGKDPKSGRAGFVRLSSEMGFVGSCAAFEEIKTNNVVFMCAGIARFLE